MMSKSEAAWVDAVKSSGLYVPPKSIRKGKGSYKKRVATRTKFVSYKARIAAKKKYLRKRKLLNMLKDYYALNKKRLMLLRILSRAGVPYKGHSYL